MTEARLPGLTRSLFVLLVAGSATLAVSAAEPAATLSDGSTLSEPNSADGDKRERLTQRLDKRRPVDSWRTEIGGREITVSGELGLDLERRAQPNQANLSRQGDRLSTRGVEAEVFYNLSDSVSLFAQWRLVSDRLQRGGSLGASSKLFIERGEMWLHSQDTAGSGLTVEIGRLKFEDDRLWWWDAELDALRVSHENGGVEVSLAAAGEIGRSRSDRRGTDPEQHRVRRWIAQVSWDWQPEQTISLYLLRHDDRSRTETVLQTVPTAAQDSSDARLTWIGARWHGDAQPRPAQSLHYWLDVAGLAGKERSLEYAMLPLPSRNSIVTGVSSSRLGGWAMDAGLRWQFAVPGAPRLSIAHASTMGGAREGIERGYRQTSLQSNKYDFGGLKDFARYGATLDPELSNLRITTIGVGFSMAGVSSLDLVYHRYRQVRPAKELRNARIEADLTGGHPGIGSGIDLVATIYPSPWIEFSTTISAFRAGAAFGVVAGRRYHYWALATKLLF